MVLSLLMTLAGAIVRPARGAALRAGREKE